MTNFLARLSLEYWYQMLIVTGFAVLMFALTVPLQGIPNTTVQLIALGVMLFGIGEHISHPLQTTLYPHGKITGYPRRHSLLGYAFDLAGIALIAKGVHTLL